jgi:hypothetical protein
MQAEARRVSRHLDLQWVGEGGLVPDTQSRGWPDPDPREVAARRAGIAAGRAGEVGLLRVSALFPLELAAPTSTRRSRRCATRPLVGARTPGAADHVTPIVLGAHVRAILPRAYVVDAVTGANWEQAGVRPDLPCEEAGALERALTLF